MIGRRVGRYEILARLGAGGMGVVYTARDESLGRLAALKFLPLQFADEEMRRRFLHEAQAASALDHPAICTIYEVGETDDGELFLAMAHYEGETLAARLAPGPLPIAQAIGLALEAAGGLAAAHAHGIVHRDVKPANLFVTSAGYLKILDFGLARRSGATRMTRSGTTLGTVAYMAPEQVHGAAVDRRADVWSLGAVLYEALTGRHPFAADNDAATLHAILTRDPPPPSAVGLPRELDGVLAALLAKDPERRTPGMESVVAALRSVAAAVGHLQQASSLSAAPLPLSPSIADGPTLAFRATPATPEPAGTPPVAEDRSVAILAFENVTRDPAVDWLATGIAESLAGDLRRLVGVEVAAREPVASAVRQAGPLDLAAASAVAVRVGARWAVWGSYQKAGGALRILVHLADASVGRAGEPIKVDGALADVFALQDRIVAELAGRLEVALSDSVRGRLAPPPAELEAYEHCARGLQLVFRMDPESFRQAAESFARAVELDPGYAMAHSGLGQMHAMRYIATTDPADLETAIGHLRRAIELDPGLADPHVWLTYALARQNRFEEAVASGRRAVALEPRNVLAHYFLAVARWLEAGLVGAPPRRWQEAVDHARRAVELAPRNQSAAMVLGDLYLRCGQYEEALEAARRAARIEQSGDFEHARFVGGQVLLGTVLARLGREDEAWASLEAGLAHAQATAHVYGTAATAFARLQQAALLFRRLDYSSALPRLRVARQEIAEHSSALAAGWLRVRLDVMAAKVFHSLLMRREEEAAIASAGELLASRTGYDFSGAWGGGPGEALFDLADYYALAQQPDLAVATLERAVTAGWREHPLLTTASGLAGLAAEPRVAELRRRLAALPALQETPAVDSAVRPDT